MKEILRFIEMYLVATSAVIICETHSDWFILPLAVAGAVCLAIAVKDEREGGDE